MEAKLASSSLPQLRLAVTCYLLTTLLIAASAISGFYSLRTEPPMSLSSAFQEITHRWDSKYYLQVVADGYSYDRLDTGENVAFFPLFPLAVASVSHATGLAAEWSGILVSQACLLASFLLLALYLQSRFRTSSDLQRWALLVFAVFPAGFYWRFIYSESVFLLLAIGTLYAMERRSSLLLAAFLVGLTTASRPVGVALIPAFLHYAYSSEKPALGSLALRAYAYIPICCWGLLAYMAFLYFRFGDPLAFAVTQQEWRLRPVESAMEMLFSFASWEPVWSVYVPNSYWHWARFEAHSVPFLSLAFWNPIVLVAFAGLTFLGWKKSWLTTREILVCVGLLSFCYFLRGFHFCMLSQARFAGVVFPIYLVVAQLLVRTPLIFRAASVLTGSVFLIYFAARFAAGFSLT